MFCSPDVPVCYLCVSQSSCRFLFGVRRGWLHTEAIAAGVSGHMVKTRLSSSCAGTVSSVPAPRTWTANSTCLGLCAGMRASRLCGCRRRRRTPEKSPLLWYFHAFHVNSPMYWRPRRYLNSSSAIVLTQKQSSYETKCSGMAITREGRQSSPHQARTFDQYNARSMLRKTACAGFSVQRLLRGW